MPKPSISFSPPRIATASSQPSTGTPPYGARPPEISLDEDPTVSWTRLALRMNSTNLAASGPGFENRARLGSFQSSQAPICGQCRSAAAKNASNGSRFG